MKQLIVTIIGADKPGIVESLSQTVLAHQGNWLASSMSELAGQFAGILQIQVAQENYQALIQALSQLENLSVTLVEGVVQKPVTRSQLVTVTCNDRPGIVQEVSQTLRNLGLNVLELNTECGSAPNWGNSLFKASAKVCLPENVAQDAVVEALESIADDLMVDIDTI